MDLHPVQGNRNILSHLMPRKPDIKIAVITKIIWGANHPNSQLRAKLEGRSYNVFEKLACKGAFGQPHQPIMTTKHSQDWKCLIFFPEGGKQDVLENPCGTAENQRQLNSHMTLAGYRTGVTLVRGKRFTHKPTMPPNDGPYWLETDFTLSSAPVSVLTFFFRLVSQLMKDKAFTLALLPRVLLLATWNQTMKSIIINNRINWMWWQFYGMYNRSKFVINFHMKKNQFRSIIHPIKLPSQKIANIFI